MATFEKVSIIVENAAPVAQVVASFEERDGEFLVYASASEFNSLAFDCTRGTAIALFQFPQMHRPEDKGAVIGFRVAEDFGPAPVVVEGTDLGAVVEAFGLAVAGRMLAR